MADVTVRAAWPVLGLEEGVTATIPRTPRVDELIARGHLTVVIGDGGPHSVDELQVGDRIETLAVPARNASRDEWASFLTDLVSRAQDDSEVASLAFTADDARAELIAKYEQWVAGQQPTEDGDTDGSSGPTPVND